RLGTAGLDAALRPGPQRPAAADPGGPAQSDQRAAALRVQPAAPLLGAQPRARPAGAPGAGGQREGTPGGLPHVPRAASADLARRHPAPRLTTATTTEQMTVSETTGGAAAGDRSGDGEDLLQVS